MEDVVTHRDGGPLSHLLNEYTTTTVNPDSDFIVTNTNWDVIPSSMPPTLESTQASTLTYPDDQCGIKKTRRNQEEGW